MTNSVRHHSISVRLIPSTRLTVTILICLGLFVQYAQRFSISIAIICMVNRTNVSTEIETKHFIYENTTLSESPNRFGSKFFKEKQFRWSELEQQLILGAYWAGYILTLIPGRYRKITFKITMIVRFPLIFLLTSVGGWLSMRFGAKRVYACFLSISTIATFTSLIMYFMSETHFIILFLSRILCGVGHGAPFPATFTILSQWAVPHERSTLTALSFSGTHIGTCKSIDVSILR